MEIIPAIIAKNFQELYDKIHLVEPYVKTVQMDVMDGIFVPNHTWPFDSSRDVEFAQGKPSVNDLNKIDTDIFLEAHLMVEAPHRVLNEWLSSKIKRIILHWEAMEKIHNHELLPYKTQVGAGFPVSNLAEEIHRYNKEFGVALNLETPISVLDNFINDIDTVLLMSVKPGQGGQEFEESVIPKIIALRQNYPSVKIAVDGGVNLQNISKLIEAGADFLVMGSAIFGSDDVGGAINELETLATKY